MGTGGFVGGVILDIVMIDPRGPGPLESGVGVGPGKADALPRIIGSGIGPLDGGPRDVDALVHDDVVLGMMRVDGPQPHDETDPPGVLP